MKSNSQTYKKIEDVLTTFADKGPLAVHEFFKMRFNAKPGSNQVIDISAREYIGVTEGTLGRRLREMARMGRVTVKRRSGAAGLVEYALPVSAPEVGEPVVV